MRKCSRCKIDKPLSEFNFKSKVNNLRQYHCKGCSRLYVQQHYNKNKSYYLKKAHKRNNYIRQEIRRYTYSYLTEHSCIDCGEKDPIVLEFDHIKDKSFNISGIGRTKTLKQVREEILKCEVRCANCHRRKTFERAGWSKYKPL